MGRLTAAAALAALLAATAITACNSDGCLDNQSALPLAEFYSSATQSVISVDSLEVVGVDAPDGDILSEMRPAKSQLYLPMRSTRQSTAWRFIYRQKHLEALGLEDRITFEYESIPYFASEECGASYRYRVTRVAYTTTLIDSIVMADSLITNVDAVAIRIYFRTAGPDQEGAES
ncbi:MAG: hypothetical protein K2L74_01690 [Muribaculaceae bacterium]|nr:hypothetical protein [Muribaculaceae bacterium]